MIRGVLLGAAENIKKVLPSPTLEKKVGLAAIGILSGAGSFFAKNQNFALRVAVGFLGAAAIICACFYSTIYEAFHKNPPKQAPTLLPDSQPLPPRHAAGAASTSSPFTTAVVGGHPSVLEQPPQTAERDQVDAASSLSRFVALEENLDSLGAGGPAAADVVDSSAARSPALTVAQREERVRAADDPKPVRERLEKDIGRAGAQMRAELEKGFVYAEAPFRGEPRGLVVTTEQVDRFQVGIASAQGRRYTMEDAHCAIPIRVIIGGREYPVQVFGVFDGHGRGEVAEYVRENIGQVLQGLLVEHNRDGLTDLGIYNALKHLGVRLQANFERERPGHARDQGTCLTAAIVLDGHLYTVNIGDSRIIMVDPAGATRQLTTDQKPADVYFNRMITSRGGFVFSGRVDGNLATARAIGDLDIASVSARGKVSDHGALVSGSRIVVACDGIWDVAASEEIGRAVHVNRTTAPGELARNLVRFCSGSGDNLSLMVVVVP